MNAPRFVWPLLIALLAFGVYANSLSNGFALDDVRLVRDNPQIREIGDIPSLFGQPYWPGSEGAGLYRPVTVTSFALNRAITGDGSLGFHLGNVLFHALACGLVWYVARGSGPYYGAALAGAGLFAVHPIHAEAVANVAGRAEILAAAGVMAAWLAYRRSRNASGRIAIRWNLVTAGFFFLAVLAKEHAILAPVLFYIDDRLSPVAGERDRFRAWSRAGTCVAVAIVAILIRIPVLGGLRGPDTTIFLDNPPAFSGTGVRIATALWVQVKYAILFVWPEALTSDYSHAAIPLVESAGDPRLWAGLGWAATLVTLFVIGWRHSRTLAIAVAGWVLFFLPSSNLLFASGTVMGERLAYLPSFGACLLFGHGIAYLGSKIDSPLRNLASFRIAVPILLCTLIVILAGLRTAVRNPDWIDNDTLAIHDVAVVPSSAKLQLGAGLAWSNRGDPDRAERAFRRAVEIYPDYAQAHFNLGQMLMVGGRVEPAIAHLEEASRISPWNPRPYKSLALLHERRGDRDAAIAAYAEGSRRDPGDLAFRFNYGRLLLATGRIDDGAAVLRELAAAAPQTTQGGLAAALVAEISGDPAGAIRIYRAILAHPDTPESIADNLRRRLETLEP